MEEWTSTKEEHVIYGLPEGTYTLHEELAPYEDGYVSASDVTFEVKEDGSVTKVEMKDEYSKVEISKTDLSNRERTGRGKASDHPQRRNCSGRVDHGRKATFRCEAPGQ